LNFFLIFLFGYIWLTDADIKITFPIILVFPFLLAIMASQKSYLSNIFNHKLFSKRGSLSLIIYLMQWVPLRIVTDIDYFSSMTGRNKVLWMIILTAMSCILYYLLVFLIEKLKIHFHNHQKQSTNK